MLVRAFGPFCRENPFSRSIPQSTCPLLPIPLVRTRRCLMNGEPVTDLTTAVYEMRSVSLQNRNSDILPRHMGQLGFFARDEDEEGAYGGLKGSPTVIFVFPQGGEQFTTRKAQLGVQRHPTTRGDVVLVQLAARVPPFLPLSKWQSSDTWPFLPVRSPNSQLARQHCAVTFPAQQMRPPNIAICLPVFRFCQLLIPTTAVFPHCTSYSCFHMSSICQCHCRTS